MLARVIDATRTPDSDRDIRCSLLNVGDTDHALAALADVRSFVSGAFRSGMLKSIDTTGRIIGRDWLVLMPLFSVTAIGLLGALVVLIRGAASPASRLTVLRGVGGAWAGFIVGALIGLIFDVVIGTGVFLAIVGHLAAVTGTVLALSARSRRVVMPSSRR